MKKELEYILSYYKKEASTIDGNSSTFNMLCKKIPNELRHIINNDNYLIKGSMGQGNKSDYPWIAIMNKKISKSVSEGLFIMLIFKKDMSGIYLTLSQSLNNFSELFGSNKYNNATIISKYFRDRINTTFLKKDIKLSSKEKDLGYGYSKTVILNKYYEYNKENWLNEETFIKDLSELISIYEDIIKKLHGASYNTFILKRLNKDYLINLNKAINIIENTIPSNSALYDKELILVKDDELNIKNDRLNKIETYKRNINKLNNKLEADKLVLEYEYKHTGSNKIMWVYTDSDILNYDVITIHNNEERRIKVILEDEILSKKLMSKLKKNNILIYKVIDINSNYPKLVIK